MDRNKPSESYLYRSLLDESDPSVRELVGYLRSNEIGELGQLYRTAEAIHRYLKSEVMDYLLAKKKASPEVVAAAMKHMTNNDPSFPGHELLSEMAVLGLSTFIRLKRDYAVHAAHDFFVSSADRATPKSTPSSIDMTRYGLGVLPQMSITGIRTKRPHALKMSWYISKQVEKKMMVLSGYNSRQLDVMYLTKFKNRPKKITPNCVVVPFEVWDSNRNKMRDNMTGFVEETKLSPELVVMANPDGLGDSEMEVRDKAAVNSIVALKEFCCIRRIPGVVIVCCPMIRHQEKMPPVAWHSLFIDDHMSTARVVGPGKTEKRLDFWRHA